MRYPAPAARAQKTRALSGPAARVSRGPSAKIQEQMSPGWYFEHPKCLERYSGATSGEQIVDSIALFGHWMLRTPLPQHSRQAKRVRCSIFRPKVSLGRLPFPPLCSDPSRIALLRVVEGRFGWSASGGGIRRGRSLRAAPPLRSRGGAARSVYEPYTLNPKP